MQGLKGSEDDILLAGPGESGLPSVVLLRSALLHTFVSAVLQGFP